MATKLKIIEAEAVAQPHNDGSRRAFLLEASDELTQCCASFKALLGLLSAARSDETMACADVYYLLNPLHDRLAGIDERLEVML